MNASIAFLGKGREVHGDDEYDPFGETLYQFRGAQQSNCHLEEALINMPPDLRATYKSKCKIHAKFARLAPDSPFADASAITCHKFLMAWVNQYWAEVEERIEGENHD